MGEWLRRWIAPIAAVVGIAITTIGGWYAVQREIFDAIIDVRTSATNLVSDVRFEVLGTTKDVQMAVGEVRTTVNVLNAAVEDLRKKSEALRDELPKGSIPELRAKVDRHDQRLDTVEKDVIRLRAEHHPGARRQ